MARKPTRRRTPSPKTGEWGVMLIDGTPIRRKARREYEKVLRDIEAAKAEAERFETQDKPQFEKWMSANFGATLTEIRELQQKLFTAQNLVNEVQQEFYYGNYRSIGKAYQKVMRRRTHPEEFEEEQKEIEEEEADFAREFEEAVRQAEERFAHEFGIDPEDLRAGYLPGERPMKEVPGRLKDLYRRLVRRLHPDKGTQRTKREIEWWHQTQEAYEQGNVERLEMILTLVEMEEQGSKDATVSVLKQLTAEFKKSLRAMKKQLTTFKRDVAWNFSLVSDFSMLLVRIRQQLKAERDQILWTLQKYEQQIKTWETAAASPGKRARARRGAWQDEEWF